MWTVVILSHAFWKTRQIPNETFLSLLTLRTIQLLLAQMHKKQRLANTQWHPWRLEVRQCRYNYSRDWLAPDTFDTVIGTAYLQRSPALFLHVWLLRIPRVPI